MKTLLIVLFSLLLSIGYAQDRQAIDSLKHELAVARHDTNKVLIGMDLSVRYWGINPDSSLEYGHQSLALAQRIHYYYGESQLLRVLGNTYRILGDYAKALDLAFKGLQIAEKNQLTFAAIECLNNIGVFYNDLKDYSKAIDYFRRGLTLAVANQYLYKATQIEMNIGSLYMDLNQIDSASYYINKAYLKSKNLPRNTTTILKVVYSYLAELQFQQGNYEKAFKYAHKSIVVNKNVGDSRFLSRGYNILSVFFKKLNQPDSSIFYAKKGLYEAQGINYKSGILDASKLLAELYESKDPKTAVYYHKIANSANDELYGPSKTLDLHKTLAEEQERQRQKEAQRTEYQNRLKQYAYLTGLLVLLLIAFLLYRNNRQKQKANVVLEKTLSTLKSTQAQLIQSEKLASLGELTAGIAHEIQNPLNFVNNFAEVSAEMLLEMDAELDKGDIQEAKAISADLQQNLSKINHHGQRASSIVKSMLEHSRASTGVKEPTDLNTLADEYLRLAYHGLRAKDNSFNAILETNFDPELPLVSVIPQDIGRVLLNLINNAFYSVAERSRSTVHQRTVETLHATALQEPPYQPTVTISTQKIDNQILIKVKDNGSGIPDSIREKIFQPFFTTKPTGQGTGLGLSLAYDIVTKGHGGTLELVSVDEGNPDSIRKGGGTEFIITLPFKTNGK